MVGKSEETKMLCSRCFRVVMGEQIVFEDNEKKEVVCYFCKEALKNETDEKTRRHEK
jgi:hypothetical protein